MDEVTKRKLKKLVSNPGLYFLDMRVLQPFWKKLHLSKEDRYPKPEQTALPAFAEAFSDLCGEVATSAPLSGISSPGGNGRSQDAPPAFAWNVPEENRASFARAFPEYEIAFFDAPGVTPQARAAISAAVGRRPAVFLFHAGFHDAATMAFAAAKDIVVLHTDIGPASSSCFPASFVVSPHPDPAGEGLTEYLRRGKTDPEQAQIAASLLDLTRKLEYGPDFWRSNGREAAFRAMHKSCVLVFGSQGIGDRDILDRDAEVLRLARTENPSRHVAYLPHWRQSAASITSCGIEAVLQSIGNASLQGDAATAALVKGAHRAYTIRSPMGLWSLVHGLPLTVLEPVFYAGLGLTDDRFAGDATPSGMTVADLLYLSCVAFPRHASGLTGAEAFISGMLEGLTEAVEIRSNLYRQFLAMDVQEAAMALKETDLWLLMIERLVLNELKTADQKRFFDYFPLEALFGEKENSSFLETLSYLFAGIFFNISDKYKYYQFLQGKIPVEMQLNILRCAYAVARDRRLHEYIGWCYEQIGELDVARFVYEQSYRYNKDLEFVGEIEYIPAERCGSALKHAQLEVRYRNLDAAKTILYSLLLSGYITPSVLDHLATIARLSFAFPEAAFLFGILATAYPEYARGITTIKQAETALLANRPITALKAYCLSYKISQSPPALDYTVRKISTLCGDFDWLSIISSMQLFKGILSKAQSCINSEDFESAYVMLRSYDTTPGEAVNYHSLLVKAGLYLNKFSEIREHIEKLLAFDPCAAYYNEAILAALHMRDYGWAKKLYDEAVAGGYALAQPVVYRMCYVEGDFHGAMTAIARLDVMSSFERFMGKKYLFSLSEIDPRAVRSLVVLADSGVGDEIRGASLYRDIVRKAGVAEISFSCDEKLHALFARSFPDLRLLPFPRHRHLAYMDDFSGHTAIPCSEYQWIMDNGIWEHVRRSDAVIMHRIARADVVTGYEALSGRPYLKADPTRVRHWRNMFAAATDKPLVGICWRSSLESYSRNMAALKLEELGELLRVDGVQFVNCQYDGCKKVEGRYLEETHPGRLFDVPCLDQLNDLDDTAALYCAMDCVVSVPNTVAEMAGALGVPTLMFTFCYEPDLLMTPGGNTNVYYHAVEHVGHDVPIGDRKALVSLLCEKISRIQARETYC